MTDNIPKFTIEFGNPCLTITYRSHDGQEVCYLAQPQDDMSASNRMEFLASVERWVNDSSDCFTDVEISVLSRVIPCDHCSDATVRTHSTGGMSDANVED